MSQERHRWHVYEDPISSSTNDAGYEYEKQKQNVYDWNLVLHGDKNADLENDFLIDEFEDSERSSAGENLLEDLDDTDSNENSEND